MLKKYHKLFHQLIFPILSLQIVEYQSM